MKRSILIVLAVVLFFFMAEQEMRPLVVLSESMNPTLQIGDLIIFKKVSPEEVKVGDILIFKDPAKRKNVLITHRVINISNGFKTKGDACEEPDPFIVKPEDVVGRAVLRIPYLGYLFGFRYLEDPQKFFVYICLVIVPAALIIGNETRKILMDKLKVRKKERKERKRMKKIKRRKSIR